MKMSGKTVYRPTEDEQYMNMNQRDYFHQVLAAWRSALMETDQVLTRGLKETETRKPDPLDQSTAASGIELDLQTRLRQQQLISQIDHALARIDEGNYGYCEMTGEEIGIKRLLAMPFATLCIKAQEQYERLARSIAGARSTAGVLRDVSLRPERISRAA